MNKPKRIGRMHIALAVLWVILLVPTILFWKNSILWVLVISVYANIVGHWSAYQASAAQESAENDTLHTSGSEDQ